VKLPDGSGWDDEYLRKGAARARRDQGDKFSERDHPVNAEMAKSFVERNYEAAAMLYQGYYMSLMHAALWRYGQHSIQINPQSFLFETIPTDMRIPRPTLNLIGDKVESVTGEILKAIPRGTVLPVDNTPGNRRGAQIGDAFLRIKDEEDELDDMNRMVAEAMTMWGDTYVEVVVDKSNARSVKVPMFAESTMSDANGPMTFPVVGPDGQPMMETLRLSDENINHITALQFFANRTATSLRDSRIAHSHVYRDIEWSRAQWSKFADKMVTASAETQAGQFQTRMQNLLLYDASRIGNLAAPMSAGDPSYCDTAALVHVVRMNPDDYYPEGRYFIVAGGQAVIGGPLPFGKLMMVHFRYSPVPNSLLSYGLVKDCIEVNRWIEQMAHQVGMIRRTMGVPFILTPEGSGGAFNAPVLPMRYGGIYTHKVGKLPQVIQPRGSMDAGVAAEMKFWLDDFFERISGRRKVQEGDRPVGVYSGSMLRQMIAQNSGRFVAKIAGFAKGQEKLNCLRLEAIAKAPASQFPRGLSFPGRAGQRLWMKFAGSEMGDNVTYKIETIALAQTDDATKVQDMFQAITVGLLDPLDPKTRIAALRLLHLEDLMNELEPNIARAQDENARIAAGEEVFIGPFENDPVHLQVHADWINDPNFWMIDKDAQMATMAHAAEHETRIKIRLREAAMAGEIPGTNPSVDGTPMLAPGAPPPGQQPGNGMPGRPQASIAAQQAPAPQGAQ